MDNNMSLAFSMLTGASVEEIKDCHTICEIFHRYLDVTPNEIDLLESYADDENMNQIFQLLIEITSRKINT